MKFLLGVDEAGRGPLAGPVAVGAVIVPEKFAIVREFPGIVDSKQMTPAARVKMLRLLRRRVQDGDVRFCVRYTSPEHIDNWGLTRAVLSATARAVRALAPDPEDISIYLDGLLRAPEEYKQQTIIGGDEAVPIIALASIAAKVMRDRIMVRFAKEFPQYGFERHKGYGTKEHYDALLTHGLCVIHRHSFIHLD